MKKYKLTDETRSVYIMKRKKVYYRIEALRDFGDVKRGDLGGWVESEDNLSHNGDCWIYDDALARDSSKVSGNAKMKDKSLIQYDVQIKDEVILKDEAIVDQSLTLTGNIVLKDGCMLEGLGVIYGNDALMYRSEKE